MVVAFPDALLSPAVLALFGLCIGSFLNLSLIHISEPTRPY